MGSNLTASAMKKLLLLFLFVSVNIVAQDALYTLAKDPYREEVLTYGFFETFTQCPICGQTCVLKGGKLYNYNQWSYDYIYTDITTIHTHNEVKIVESEYFLISLCLIYLIIYVLIILNRSMMFQ